MTSLTASTGAPFARVLSIASAVPSRVVDNAEMCTYIDSSDEWIQQRTGIAERRWVGEGETVETMALDAARTALERAGIEASELGAVIISTVTYFHQTPSLAAKVAFRLGSTAAAFDISAACAGFCHGIALARDAIKGGTSTYALVIGVERLSDITDTDDRGTAFIFADGAGAAIVGPSETDDIGPVVWGSDGGNYDLIRQKEDWMELVTSDSPGIPHLVMDGNPVFRWAVFTMAKVAQETLEKSGITADDLDVFLPHQANLRIVDALARAVHLPERVQVADDIIHNGNTSAASIPLALHAMLADGRAKSGDKALMIAFGAGLSYAAQVVTVP